MRELKCLKIYMAGILWPVFFISLYLFTIFFYKATEESFGAEDIPAPPDGLRRPLIISIFFLTFLSIGTYAVFMLGILRLNTRLMMPWALVIGFKCIAGGVLLIYSSNFVTSPTLLQGIIYYLATVLSFVCIYYCYRRIVVVKKTIAERLPVVEKLSIIWLSDDEKHQASYEKITKPLI